MEKDLMIRRTFHARKTVISVVNWSSYQDTQDTTRDISPDTPPDTPPDTNKKKEDRRDDIGSAKPKIASKEKASLEKARGIMAEFNQRAGKSYRDHTSSEHLTTIRARLEDGFTKEEMIEIIDHKVKTLKGTEDECKWLNPTTLFRPQNFERNLDWARNADNVEIAKLRKEFREHEMSNPSQAADIRKKIMEIRQKNNGEVSLQP
jgi:uncharacterized phage protein (TIGR02220 family)